MLKTRVAQLFKMKNELILLFVFEFLASEMAGL